MTALPKLAVPAQRALASAGITTLEGVAKRSEAELMELHGMGPSALTALKAALASKGLKLKK